MTKHYSNAFKFKVVLDLLEGNMTIAQIISKYQVSKSVIHKWKKQFMDNGPSFFNSKATPSVTQQEADLDRLHATIGRLKVENDFLQKAWSKVKE